jgi:hypothetical protein
MAQDFYAAFAVGEDDRHVTSIDEGGVALTAIKGLYERTDREIAKTRRENQTLRVHLAAERRELTALSTQVYALEKR